jgi:hypothetical protein
MTPWTAEPERWLNEGEGDGTMRAAHHLLGLLLGAPFLGDLRNCSREPHYRHGRRVSVPVDARPHLPRPYRKPTVGRSMRDSVILGGVRRAILVVRRPSQGPLLDHLVDGQLDRQRHGKAERLSSLGV